MYFDNNFNCCFVLDLLHRMKRIDLVSLIHTRVLYNCLRTSIYTQSVSLTYLLNQRALYLLHVSYRQVIHAIQLKLSVNDTLFSPPFFLSLHIAAAQGQAECLAVILAHGADVSLQDASGWLQQCVFLHYFYVTSVTHNE